MGEWTKERQDAALILVSEGKNGCASFFTFKDMVTHIAALEAERADLRAKVPQATQSDRECAERLLNSRPQPASGREGGVMSREIDRKVAEALGWTEINETPTRGLMGNANRVSNAKKWKVPFYSTDIAAAIGALEEFCKTRHWTCKLEMLAHDGLWVVWIYSANIDNCRSYGGEVKERLPLAICSAILAANAGEGKG